MVGGSPKVDQSRDVVLELNQFSDTSSSSSSTCSDLSIPSCSSSSLYSGYTTSRIGSDTESASSTPRTTPSKNIPRPGKPGSATKGSHQRTNSTHSNSSMKSSHQNVPQFELQEDPDFWNDHNVQVWSGLSSQNWHISVIVSLKAITVPFSWRKIVVTRRSLFALAPSVPQNHQRRVSPDVWGKMGPTQ